MAFLFHRRSRFAQALDDYGLHRCSAVGRTIVVGLGPDPEYRRTPLERLPEAPPLLSFVAAPEQAALLSALAASREAGTLVDLMIGTSHDYAVAASRGKSPRGYDMAPAVAALGRGQFPALKTLSLGDMMMLFNGHRCFGTLGEVSHVFAIAPQLEDLELYGNFTLRQPVRHDRLRDLTAQVDDVGCYADPLDQQTVSALLSSALPALSTLDLELGDGSEDGGYAIPEAFFAGTGMPALSAFAIDWVAPAERTRLADWKAGRGLR